ncbi:Z-ring formation inhibitor MciZ [Xylanibacillus composti]|nr:Z-ring formation inhibitor MciZ [Xylanibacillus composti]
MVPMRIDSTDNQLHMSGKAWEIRHHWRSLCTDRRTAGLTLRAYLQSLELGESARSSHKRTVSAAQQTAWKNRGSSAADRPIVVTGKG